MNDTTRRTILKTVASIPIIGGIAKVVLFGWDNPFDSTDGKAREERYLAVRIVRLINTAQRHYFEAYGRYADLAELWQSDPVNRWLDSSKAEKAQVGRSLVASLKFNAGEVAPGWGFTFEARTDRSGYLVAVFDSARRGLGAFASDQDAVIYEGKSIASTTLDPTWMSAAELVAGSPINSGQHPAPTGRFATVLRTLAVGPITAQAGCECGEFPCCCWGSCNSGWVPGCTNCGCSGCIWCC